MSAPTKFQESAPPPCLVEAHGTGTVAGDAEELSALDKVYRAAGAKPGTVALGSVKSMIGHTKAAAGSASMIKAVLSLYHKTLPPTIKVKEPTKLLKERNTPFYLSTQTRPWLSDGAPRRAAVSAMGFGGTNFHVILEEADAAKQETDWDGDIQIAAFSAKDISSLKAQLPKLEGKLSWDEVRLLAKQSRDSFKVSDKHRLVLVLENGKTDVPALAVSAARTLDNGQEQWTLAEGAFYGSGSAQEVSVLFPGQGAQYPGMLRDIVRTFPHALETVSSAAWLDIKGSKLGAILYPPPSFDDAVRKKQAELLKDTAAAQPALGAVELAVWKTLAGFGLKPSAFAGHSYGELAALCAAGSLEDEKCFALSALRGALMSGAPGERGGMLAVLAPLADIEKAVSEEKLQVSVANKNAPLQTVLSGKLDEIDRAAAVFTKRGLKSTKLQVSAGFHSPLVADALPRFKDGIGKAGFKPPVRPVYANKSAGLYPHDGAACVELLSSQLVSPVEFVGMINAMYSAGIRVFVETGPGARLTGLVDAILSGKPHAAFSLDASSGAKPGLLELGKALARLSSLGVKLDLPRWEAIPVEAQEAKDGFVMKLTGANYRSPRPAPPLPKIDTSVRPAAPQYQPAQYAPQYQTQGASGDLRALQDSMNRLSAMQEQAALLHAKFLESQEQAQRALQALIEQQQGLLAGRPLAVAPVAPQPPVMPVFVPPSAPLIPPPPPPPTAKSAAPSGEAQKVLIEIVSRQTGYPVEALKPGMDMESDLGIDSIKRVAILAEVQEKLPGAPQIKPEHLGTMRTLKQVAEYLSQGQQTAPAQGAAPSKPAAQSGEAEKVLIEIVSKQTGYPVEALKPGMDMESDLGIDSIKRVAILAEVQEKLPGAPQIKPEHLGTMRTLKQVAEYLSQGQQTAPAQGAAPSKPAAQSGEAEKVLIEIVSKQTGYPVEALKPGMDMESDLGIDSIKRVAILAEVQEKLPHAPQIKPEHLGTMRTLKQVAEYLSQGQQSSAPVQAASPAQPVAQFGSGAELVEKTLIEIVSKQTGYPVEALKPGMDMESDLGIDSIKRVAILAEVQEKLPGTPQIKPEHLGTMRTLRQVSAYLSQGAVAAAPVQEQQSPRMAEQAEHDIARLILKLRDPEQGRQSVLVDKKLPIIVSDDGCGLSAQLVKTLSEKGYAAKLVKDSWRPATGERIAGLALVWPSAKLAPSKLWDDKSEERAERLFLLAQAAGPLLRAEAASGGAVFMTVSRLDGGFGLKGLAQEQDPVQGSLSGLAKTAALEWPEVSCKAVDVDFAWDHNLSMADALSEELFLKGPSEIGLSSAGRKALVAEESAQPAPTAAPEIKGRLVLVSGGARGVTAEAAAALAPLGPVLALLGRTPVDGDYSFLDAASTENDMKRIIFSQRPGITPRDASKLCAEALAVREIKEQLRRFETLGAKAVYVRTDINDADSVKAVVCALQDEYGPAAGVVHGSGVLADKLILNKTPEQFRQVFCTKVTGLRNLLNAVEPSALKLLALFSSSTARYGRVGQCDYAMANEALNKAARLLFRRLPQCRVTAFNWGPWDGGMVNDGLKKLFASEGIGLIGLRKGGAFLLCELSGQNPPAEVVVLGRLPGAETPSEPQPAKAEQKPALSRALEFSAGILEMPVLRSHVINGRAVLPAALMTEFLGQAALHLNPGFHFCGFDSFTVYKGLVLDPGESRRFTLHSSKARKGEGFHAASEMRSDAGLHCAAEIMLSHNHPHHSEPPLDFPVAPYGKSLDRVYRDILFHGPDLRVISAVRGLSADGIVVQSAALLEPAHWLKNPPRDHWLADPSALDAAYQALIIWTTENMGAGSLPNRVASYRQFRQRFPKEGVTVLARITATTGHSATADIDFVDSKGALVARMKGYECTVDASLKEAFGRNAVPSAQLREERREA